MAEKTEPKTKLRYLTKEEIMHYSADAAEVLRSRHASEAAKIHARTVLRHLSVKHPSVGVAE